MIGSARLKLFTVFAMVKAYQLLFGAGNSRSIIFVNGVGTDLYWFMAFQKIRAGAQQWTR